MSRSLRFLPSGSKAGLSVLFFLASFNSFALLKRSLLKRKLPGQIWWPTPLIPTPEAKAAARDTQGSLHLWSLQRRILSLSRIRKPSGREAEWIGEVGSPCPLIRKFWNKELGTL